MMKKKVATLAIAGLLAGVALAGGTLAYLTDTGAATNTMTIGKVSIEQSEWQRIDPTADASTDSNLKPFEQNQTMIPAASGFAWEGTLTTNGHTYDMFNGPQNAIDKIVTVKNTGNAPAYIRTIFLFEDWQVDNNTPVVGYDGEIATSMTDLLHVNVDVNAQMQWIEHVTLADGKTYLIGCYTYPTALAADAISAASLLQFFWNQGTTNEDFADRPLVNGQADASPYQVLVLSQAVQSDGFVDGAAAALNEAFGAVNAANVAEWFNA